MKKEEGKRVERRSRMEEKEGRREGKEGSREGMGGLTVLLFTL